MCVFVEAEDVQHETLANICHLIFSVQKKKNILVLSALNFLTLWLNTSFFNLILIQ